VFRALLEDDPKVRMSDITKTDNIINWKPKVYFGEGIEEKTKWFKKVI